MRFSSKITVLAAIFALMFGACHTSRKVTDLQPKGLDLADPYVGGWDFVVEDTPSGDAEGTIYIYRAGGVYMAELDTQLGEMKMDRLSIERQRLKGSFKYKGFNVHVKGTFVGDTLEGKVGVTLMSYPMSATKRHQYTNAH